MDQVLQVKPSLLNLRPYSESHEKPVPNDINSLLQHACLQRHHSDAPPLPLFALIAKSRKPLQKTFICPSLRNPHDHFFSLVAVTPLLQPLIRQRRCLEDILYLLLEGTAEASDKAPPLFLKHQWSSVTSFSMSVENQTILKFENL